MHFSSHLNGFFYLTREEKVKSKTQFKCKFGEVIKLERKVNGLKKRSKPTITSTILTTLLGLTSTSYH